MKLGLINPGRSGTSTAMPLGLGYIASYARNKGHDVLVLDMEVEPKRLNEFLGLHKYDFIGLTISTALYTLSAEIIKKVKAMLPDVPIIVGGPHVTAVESEIFEIPGVDIAVIGEGEETIAEILENNSLSEIKGIIYKKDGNFEKNEKREYLSNLDALPFPAWDLFPLKKYSIHPPYGKKKKFMNIMTSRGCPFRCAYCSKIFGRTYRSRSPENVIKEIEFLIQRYGTEEIRFYDDDFTMSKNNVHAICDLMISKKLNIIWSCTTRIDLVDYQLLKKMKKAGCWVISYGVESGNQEILDRINKGYTIEQVKKAFGWSKKLGIKTLGFFMLGLPGETKKTIQESINLAKEIKADYTGWGITVVFPGTDLKKLFDGRAKRFIPYASKPIGFAPDVPENKYMLIAEENLTRKELEDQLERIKKIMYLNYSFILKEIASIRSFGELFRLVKTGIAMLKN